MLRSLSLQLQGEPETQLPLTRSEDLIKTDDVLDLSKTQPDSRNSACSIKIYRKNCRPGELICLFSAVLCCLVLNRKDLMDGVVCQL